MNIVIHEKPQSSLINYHFLHSTLPLFVHEHK